MNRHVWIAALLTIIAVAAFIELAFFQTHAGLPFDQTHQQSVGYVIEPTPGIPLPPGLQNGDVLQLQLMTPAARAAMRLPVTIKAGLTYDMVVHRGNRNITVPVTSTIPPQSFNHQFNHLAWLGNLMFFAFLALGLLALWRGRSLATWGLALMALNVDVVSAVRGVPVSATVGIGVDILANCVVVPVIAIGLYIMVYALIGEGVNRHIKRLFTLVFMLSVALLVILSLTRTIGIIYFAWSTWPTPLLPMISMFLGLIPFVMLVLGYTRAGPEQRLRIRWILWSTGILFLALIASVSTQAANTPATQVLCEYAQALLFILATVGYTYAVLRQRLVDVRIVLNRTLVYGVMTAVVVGVFAAINSVVEHATLGSGASLLLELIVPLALGIVLGSLRKYVDGYLNRFLFRRQYRAEKALNDFARTCGFIEQPEHLLNLTARQVFDHSRARGVAVYERDAQAYVRVRQQGDAGFPERVEADDLAFVKLRAGDHEADLHEVASALGADGYVFSMAVRGKVIGALVCGPRPAEQYTADERALLFHVAQQVGAALHALRSREHENFVDSVARGALDAESARERARKLMAAWQTA